MSFKSFSSLLPRRVSLLLLLLVGSAASGAAPRKSGHALEPVDDPWYISVGLGTSFGQCTFRSITEHSTDFGAQGGIYGGYRLNKLFSVETGLQFGAQTQRALDCCPYWLSESMERNFYPVNGQKGWYYHDLEDKTQWAKLSVQANFDLFTLFTEPDNRWSLNLSPQVSAATTATRLITPDSEMDFDRQWHAGLGGQASVGYQVTPKIGLLMYSGITCLTGDRFDNIPEHGHKSNLIWDAGLKLSLNISSSKAKPAAHEIVPEPVVPQPEIVTPEPVVEEENPEAERMEAERLAAEQAAREQAAREEAERQAAIEKERAFNTPIPTVYFVNNGSDIEESYIQQLEMALAILERYPDFKLEIHAYCSWSGTKEYNNTLSQKRMEVVRKWFADHGISMDRMGQAYYHGIDYDAPSEAQARRAELKFVK